MYILVDISKKIKAILAVICFIGILATVSKILKIKDQRYNGTMALK